MKTCSVSKCPDEACLELSLSALDGEHISLPETAGFCIIHSEMLLSGIGMILERMEVSENMRRIARSSPWN